MKENQYSDYIIYADESGDLSLVDKEYPVFVLAFCIFSKNEYLTEVVRQIKGFKFATWGHDMIVLHSKKIRIQTDDFRFLQGQFQRKIFMKNLTQIIENLPFTVIATGIDKRLLPKQYINFTNPYELALQFCLERLYQFLQERKQNNRLTHIVIESRMSNQNRELDKAFVRITEKNPLLQKKYPVKLIFGDKKTNSIGLQLADLIAYPIGRYVLKPHEENLSFKTIEQKFHKFPHDSQDGLKIFPKTKDDTNFLNIQKMFQVTEPYFSEE